MLKPTSNEIEFLYYGSYYKDEDDLTEEETEYGAGGYCEELDTKFELVDRQFSVGATSYDYVSDSIRALVVVKNTETGELWGAEIQPNSWHEESLNLEDDEILPVELQEVVRQEYVFVED